MYSSDELSQERVYKFQENEAAKQPSPKKKRKLNNPGKIQVVLEKNPKWELLEQVLKDIGTILSEYLYVFYVFRRAQKRKR